MSTQQGGSRIPSKTLQLVDKVYEDSYIKSVQLYPETGKENASLYPPVLPIGHPYGLVLRFDDLADKHDDYYAYFVPCDERWKKIPLSNNVFLDNMNDFPIIDFSYFTNTPVPYVKYQYLVPRLKRSGNYVLVVYRGLNKRDLILSRRLMIVQPSVSIEATIKIPLLGNIEARDSQHQILLNLRYESTFTSSPLQELVVFVRQNQRWDNMKKLSRPTRVMSNGLDFDAIADIRFPSPRAFRGFDLRPMNFRGKNVARVERAKTLRARLHPDRPRAAMPYVRENDLHGSFLLPEDMGAYSMQADYFLVDFLLRSQPIDQELYVVGGFNAFEKEASNRMRYDERQKGYVLTLLLKQGYYDYAYETREEPAQRMEGYFVQTQQRYEVFVYHKPIQQPFDTRLVGYYPFLSRP